MRFGKTLRESMFPPWRDKYLDYSKLKSMLREDQAEDESPWTEEDERQFCDEILTVQLDKVAKFQEETHKSLKERVDAAMEKLKELAPTDGQQQQPKSNITTGRYEELKAEMDAIVNEVNQLKRYSSINYTGFRKIVKKHDRKRGDRYKIRPMMMLRLSECGFNSDEAYSPLLRKLSSMYLAVNSQLEGGEEQLQPDPESQEELHDGEIYTAHKFWIHEDNLLEVKTNILRRLPALVYSEQSSKEPEAIEDPSITSLYFDNAKFDLYSKKVDRQVDVSSLRLRWSGALNSDSEIELEQKIIYENGSSEEKKFAIKDKYIKPYLDGEYKMEKTIQKMERQGQPADQIAVFKDTADSLQAFIIDNKLEPVMRANYTRTAFQKPADDRVRISIDSNIAFIREDTLDKRRPCRDPAQWHRTDIDNSKMTYPFKYINQSELSKFPYSVLEIKLREEGGNRKRPEWIEELMGSHLVHSAPHFSKFVHGVASLLEDYVNNLPFWLGDLETDIRQSPTAAFAKDQQRKASQFETDQVVGSFFGKKPTGSFRPTQSSPMAKSYLSERAAADAKAAVAAANEQQRAAQAQDQGEEEGESSSAAAAEAHRDYGTLSSVFPSFSIAGYRHFKRDRRQSVQKQLPEGVVAPEIWLKNQGELKIEPKVWLANERTFLRWQHICILLGGLAVSLYTAAGENLVAECMGVAYIAIAVVAGGWGYYMLKRRRDMIVERSGRDFDNPIGPMVVSVALMAALIINFWLAWRRAFGRLNEGEGEGEGGLGRLNGTMHKEGVVEELF